MPTNLTLAVDQFLQRLIAGERHDADALRRQRADGLLDDEEALKVVRDVLFYNIRCPRLRKLEDREFCACVTQAVPLRGPRMPSRAQYGVSTEVKNLSPDQYTTFRNVRTQAPAGASVVLRRHFGRCEACGRSKERLGILVTLDWHGRPLSREYGLEA